VDHDVDRAQGVHLIGEGASLVEVSEVSDHDDGALRQQVLYCVEPTLCPHVNNDPMPLTE